MSSNSPPWVIAQKNTFENWVNQNLIDTDSNITDLKIDFKDGTKLYLLYRILTKKQIKEVVMKPKHKINKMINLNCVINEFKNDQVALINISAEDVYDENLKIILGFVWCLIKKYQIMAGHENRDSKSAPKKLMLKFVNSVLKEERAKNFTTDWKDGEILSDLLNEISPGVLPKEERPTESDVAKIEHALTVGEEKMQIPKVIQADYIADAVDELSLMTYVSYIKKKYEEMTEEISAAASIAYGPGIKETLSNSESPYEFFVELRNAYGVKSSKHLPEDPVNGLNVQFEGPQTVVMNITPKEPGVHMVKYDATIPGDYTAKITFGATGPEIKNSPAKISITGAPVDISGSGVTSTDKFVANETKEIIVKTGTKVGGLLEENIFDVSVTKFGSTEKLEIVPKDNENGTYHFSFVPQESGAYEVKVKVWNKMECEKNVNFGPQYADINIDKSIVEYYDNNNTQENVKNVRANSKLKLRAKIYDNNGNKITSGNENKKCFKVKTAPEIGHECIQVMTDPEAAEDYLIVVNIPSDLSIKSGDLAISVLSKDDEHIKNSPIQVKVHEPAPESIYTTVTGEIAEKKTFPANRATGLLVTAKDAANDTPLPYLSVSVDLKKKSDGESVGDITVNDLQDGSYQVNIDSIDSPGTKFTANVSVEGKLVKSVDCECVEGTAPELVQGTFTFSVKAMDSKGQPKSVGGDDWEVTVKGPKESVIDVETKDCGDGTYTATYSLQAMEGEHGEFVVSAKLDGRHVASSPFKHYLSPKPSVGERIKNFFSLKKKA